MTELAEPINSDLFKSLMRKIASSVTVITTAHDGHLHGMTATAMSSVTADPPTILIVVNKSTRSHPLISASGNFIVNILADHQDEIGNRFAGKHPDQFEGISYTLGWKGIPILGNAAAHIECTTVSETEVGTHTIFIGRVVGGGVSHSHPLVYHEGNYKFVTQRKASDGIAAMFVNRWSPRHYADTPISDAEMMHLFEAARWAPSASNRQPWRFVYVRRGEPNWENFVGALNPSNQAWAQHAAALIAVLSRTHNEVDGKPTPSKTHSFDAGASWMSFALQANLSGWHTRGMAGFNADKVKDALEVPGDYIVNAVVAIGKKGDIATIPDDLKAREVPTQREPLSEIVSHGKFGAAVPKQDSGGR